MNYQAMLDALPRIVEGIPVTLALTAVSLALGIAIAVPLAIVRVSGRAWANHLVFGYTFVFRGTPLLVQLYLIYYGSGQFRHALEAVGLWSFFREPWNCAILSLTLCTAAYTTEIIRGAILAVPRADKEAGIAFGMTARQRYRFIVLPQAFAFALPAYANEVVFQLQSTALVSLITIFEITGRATLIANRTYLHYEMYITAALIYLVLVYAVLALLRLLERRLRRHITAKA